MGIQVISAVGANASFDGVFFPRTDLQAGGLATDAEIADAVAANVRRDKALFAFLMVMTASVSALAAQDRLGVTVTTPDTTSSNYVFGLGMQRYTQLNASDPFQPVPVPASGANLGRGDIALVDMFPNVAKYASGAAIAEAGLLIESAPLANYGAPSHASIDVTVAADNRDWLMAFMQWLVADTTALPSRSTTVASAVVGRSNGTANTVTVPTAYYQTTDPTAGLAAADIPYTVLVTWPPSTVTFNTSKAIAGDGTQTWDVNSVTA